MSKQALLVGINDYQGISDLRGCINDVLNVRGVLKDFFGFTNKEIRVLTDQRATKFNILHRLNAMVEKAQPGDFIFFHFSGHGSQIRDRDGDELRDEMDELICPYDMNWDDGYITDDTLNEIFTQLPPGVFLEVVLDSCHSGTGLKDVTFGRPSELGLEHPTLYRYLPPPLDIQCRFQGEKTQLKPTRRIVKANNCSQVHHILWAGCRENQTSADAYIESDYNGAFTYYLCKALRESQSPLTRSQLLEKVKAFLSAYGYSQIPQLECAATVRDARSLTSDILTPVGVG